MKKILLLSILAICTTFAGFANYNYPVNNGFCCEPYDCCDESPLSPGSWSVAFGGGVMPSWYTDRGRTHQFTSISAALFNDSFVSTQFNNQFHLPWILQAELGYMICCDWQLFFDFDYSRASGRSNIDRFEGTVSFDLNESFGHYSAYGFYLGTRYYLSCFNMCDFYPFVGFKVGILHRDRVRATLQETIPGVGTVGPLSLTIFDRDNTVSGGAQVGIEYFFSRCLSLGLKAEFLAAGARHSEVSVLSIGGAGFGGVIGNTGVVFSIPVILSLRYSFGSLANCCM